MNQVCEGFNIERLKKEFNLADTTIQASGLSIQTLTEIYNDYCNCRYDDLVRLKNEFLTDYICPAQDQKGIYIHSYGGRVKEPYHVIEKLVRKCNTNARKYSGIDVSNYYKFLTDLIGIRILLVYKKDWETVHNYLLSCFYNAPERYLNENDYVKSYDQDTQDKFFIECPKAYIRPGDSDNYTGLTVCSSGYYRSLHYIPRYGDYCVEIQVRTLFEEAWGEVDHDVLYPYHKDDEVLVGYSRLINRAAGMGDEMSSFFKAELLPTRTERTSAVLDVPIMGTRSKMTPSTEKEYIHSEKYHNIDKTAEPVSPKELLGHILCYPHKDE